jgi:hypothetical protein
MFDKVEHVAFGHEKIKILITKHCTQVFIVNKIAKFFFFLFLNVFVNVLI